MKFVLSFVSLMLSFSFASAAQDSVAVFLRAEKIVVLINEANNGRLQEWMNHLGLGTDLFAVSADENIRLSCGRRADVASCTFRLIPSASVKLNQKTVIAQASLAELQLPAVGNFEMSFASSREDKMTLKIQDGILQITASKRAL